jgi:hypothetical protein
MCCDIRSGEVSFVIPRFQVPNPNSSHRGVQERLINHRRLWPVFRTLAFWHVSWFYAKEFSGDQARCRCSVCEWIWQAVEKTLFRHQDTKTPGGTKYVSRSSHVLVRLCVLESSWHVRFFSKPAGR